MRLTICDATTACFEGGPGFKPQYSWKENALIVSQDPVALDYTGWRIIESKRAEKKLKTLEADEAERPTTSLQRRMRSIDWARTIRNESRWLRCRRGTSKRRRD